jgi:NADH-quinone oxidoreductase subunit F
MDYAQGKSLCPLAGSPPRPVRSSIKHFRDEYLYHIHEKHCLE